MTGESSATVAKSGGGGPTLGLWGGGLPRPVGRKPRAVIDPRDSCVAVLGHTTGSHLGLTDQVERALSVIWLAEVREGQLRCWRLLEDTPDRRAELGFAPSA